MSIRKTIPYLLAIIALGVVCEMQRREFNRIEKKVDGLYAICQIDQNKFNGVADAWETGWIHDGWCTLLPHCNPRCICHDHCGPICSTWRKNVMDGIIPIDNGLAEGQWYTAEDVIDLMKANLENRRIAKLSPEEREAHYERERERAKKEAAHRLSRVKDDELTEAYQKALDKPDSEGEEKEEKEGDDND